MPCIVGACAPLSESLLYLLYLQQPVCFSCKVVHTSSKAMHTKKQSKHSKDGCSCQDWWLTVDDGDMTQTSQSWLTRRCIILPCLNAHTHTHTTHTHAHTQHALTCMHACMHAYTQTYIHQPCLDIGSVFLWALSSLPSSLCTFEVMKQSNTRSPMLQRCNLRHQENLSLLHLLVLWASGVDAESVIYISIDMWRKKITKATASLAICYACWVWGPQAWMTALR